MLCKSCKKEIPEISVYCMFCGRKQTRQIKQRVANGLGSAYKRGNTWTAKAIIGWRIRESDGKKVPITKYQGGFASRKEAMAYIPTLLQKPVIKIQTFYEVYERWKIQHAERVDSVTMGCYTAAFRYFKDVHHQKITDVTAIKLQKCIDNCPNGKRTKQNMKAVAGLVMKYAIDDRQISVNAAQNLYIGNDPTTHHAPITEAELEIIRKAFYVERYAKYVYAMCYLGFRPTEFLTLKKDDYYVDKDTHFLVAGIKTDAGKDRAVTIPPKILPIIQERLAVEGTNLLFPRDRNGKYDVMSEDYFRDFIFKPMMERLGIKGRTPYSARHTYSNKIKRVKGADRDKAELMGHTDYELTKKVYQSTDLEERKKITDQL